MEPSQEPLFRIKKPVTPHPDIHAYWIESSAPLNVDDLCETQEDAPTLKEMDGDVAIQKIAAHLNRYPSPQMVIAIHGFNNSFLDVLSRFTAAYGDLTSDPAICEQKGLVCIGYRWPSEKMGAPFRSLLAAAPRTLLWLFRVALAVLLVAALLSLSLAFGWARRPGLHWSLYVFDSLLYALGSLLAAVPFTAFLERIAAYFRDAYRAANYGVTDLLEVIRHVDREANTNTANRVRAEKTRIGLSFIGHSMGAFVVTNLVRILTDVFVPETMTASVEDNASSGAGPQPARDEAGRPDSVMSQIGNVFTLERLVLVSPDIPAETLFQGRANFLQSSLRRFPEAYLFSNEGDEALRMISTAGNYFSFPTLNSDFGYRLGNVNVVKPASPAPPQYGIVNLGSLRNGLAGEALRFLTILRAGRLTLVELAAKVATTTRSAAGPAAHKTASDSPLPALFTYFDCTDYVDDGRAVMTFAQCQPSLSDWDHFHLLCQYLNPFNRNKIDVHSGYFSAPFTQRLIYRLSCLGLGGTISAEASDAGGMTGLDRLSAECQEHQIQVLLSPEQYKSIPSALRGSMTAGAPLSHHTGQPSDPAIPSSRRPA